MLELHAIIHGRVQAIGFRTTARSFAEQMDLKGIVRNKLDGSVEIIAQGTKEHLEKFVDKLKTAFNGDYIEEIEISYVEPKASYEGFSIAF